MEDYRYIRNVIVGRRRMHHNGLFLIGKLIFNEILTIHQGTGQDGGEVRRA